MKDFKSKTANHYLNEGHRDLGVLFTKIKRLNELSHLILPLLEPTTRKYCRIANIHGNQLVFLVANASIATQLRFMEADLLAKFKNQPALSYIKTIQYKVRPVQTKSMKQSTASVQLLSNETANLVMQMAESLEDPELRKIMMKIASNKQR